MKKARMNISHFRFILFNLKIFGEIVSTLIIQRSNACNGCYENIQKQMIATILW